MYLLGKIEVCKQFAQKLLISKNERKTVFARGGRFHLKWPFFNLAVSHGPHKILSLNFQDLLISLIYTTPTSFIKI